MENTEIIVEPIEQETEIVEEPEEQNIEVNSEEIEVVVNTNYEILENKPSINEVELVGNKSLSDLGIQPAGEYLTEETDPIFSSSPSANITNQDISNWNNKSDFSGSYDDLSNKPTIPSKTSDLVNDSDFATNDSIPTKTSDLTNNSGYIDKTVNDLNNYTLSNELSSVATSGSYNDLSNKPDLSQYITKAVNDLEYYYKKSETYTQTEVNNLLSTVSSLDIEIVEQLPTQDISTSTIYLVPKSTSQTDNVYDEYIYVSNNWELIGDTEIDLSGYQTKIDSSHKLDADLVDDTNTTNKFVTASDKTNWNNKSDFSGSYNDLTNKPTIPTVPTNVSAFTNDAGYTTNTGTITSVKMNGSTVSTSGEADLGTVITQHQDISGKQDIIQYSTMPTASAETVGKIIQYTGATTNDYTNGYFYVGASDEEETPTYSWENLNVQQGGGSSQGLTVLSYGNSTWSDFETAYNNNSIVYCKASSGADPSSGHQGRMAFMAFVANNMAYVEFQYVRSVASHTINQQGDQIFVYKLTKQGVWSVTTREMSTKIAAGTGLKQSYSNGTLTLSSTDFYRVNLSSPTSTDLATLKNIYNLSDTARNCVILLNTSDGSGYSEDKLYSVYKSGTWLWISQYKKLYNLSPYTSQQDSSIMLFYYKYYYDSVNDTLSQRTGYFDEKGYCLETRRNYTTPYTPLYDGSPATKKYVDDFQKYSTTETIAGKWTDDKTLYKKVVYISALPDNATELYDIFSVDEIDNIDTCFIDEGNSFMVSSGGGNTEVDPINWIYSTSAFVFTCIRNKQIRIITKDDKSGSYAYITVKYTKVTE